MKTVAIVGPTASGKSDLALELADDIFEIVSADSVQVYRYMDIGSCKPDKKDRERVRHYMIDIVDPDFKFTAGEFCCRAKNACGEIAAKSKIPLFAGGTGLYIDSFFSGISEIPDIDRSVRIAISEEADNDGLESLYIKLVQCDPVFAGKIHPNDRQRIIRGLEVYRGTGKPFSEYHGKVDKNPDLEVLFIGLDIEREELGERINSRVDRMIEKGLIEEVKTLRRMGFGPELNSMKSIGYAEINDYLGGGYRLEETIEKIKINTKRYAKKQMTWFKKNEDVIWFKAVEIKRIKEKIKNWLN